MVIVFDIETGPESPEVLEALKPQFEAARNLKDPEKIAADIAAKETEWVAKAALSAVTGRVLAIGLSVLRGGETEEIVLLSKQDGEAEILRRFWALVLECVHANGYLIGHNIGNFDVPFLVRRSWKLGVDVPEGVFGKWGPNDRFLDTMREWQCGNKMDSVKLDTLAKFFGVGAKNGDGAEFANLLERDEESAIAYLKNDIAMTEGVARRLFPSVFERKADAAKGATSAARESLKRAPKVKTKPAAEAKPEPATAATTGGDEWSF